MVGSLSPMLESGTCQVLPCMWPAVPGQWQHLRSLVVGVFPLVPGGSLWVDSAVILTFLASGWVCFSHALQQ